MPANVLYFGRDRSDCLTALKSAGFHVHSSSRVFELQLALRDSADTEAVLISEADGKSSMEAAGLARVLTLAPLVLLQSAEPVCDEAGFDLVVPYRTDPDDWVYDLANLILRGRLLRRENEQLRFHAEVLRTESEALHKRIREERELSKRQRTTESNSGEFNSGLIGRPKNTRPN
jgi:hypothetical protein